ncbi:MAG: DUF6788 family protein [Planctomycetales bacterium]
MTSRLSALRSQLTLAEQELPRLLQLCFERAPLLPGSLYTLRRKCGKSNCRCTRGELHESSVLSYRGQGPPRNISPAPEQIDAWRRMTDDYRRVRQVRAEFVRWQRKVLALLDAMEAARVALGEAEFQKRGSAAVKSRSRSHSSRR